ncbi:Hypothetical predicted protein [Marmota monax]|uniref:Uncharacterized protein n=1 Tax=Marmota monax TaxID=9995 RepID=A0A5E4BGA4_MARMO|nr:Hypothetical predicted protein [Marmota monax]
MRSQKPRRRPDSCHAFHPEENAQDCGGASDTSAWLPLLLLPLGAWVLPLQLLRSLQMDYLPGLCSSWANGPCFQRLLEEQENKAPDAIFQRPSRVPGTVHPGSVDILLCFVSSLQESSMSQT